MRNRYQLKSSVRLLLIALLTCCTCFAYGQRHMENLGRGVVAVRTNSGNVFVSWRLLGTEPLSTGFNLYRGAVKVNDTPITTATNYNDNTTANESYTVRAVVNGVEQAASAPATVWAQQYLRVPIQQPAGGTTPTGEAYTYTANDCSVGDLDGDGEYEIILKWEPTNAKDNSQSGYTGNVYLDAYKMNGTRLWRIDLGRNIRAGAHYTQFMVYDFDSDGKAELACKTADGTTDGQGVVIGSATADYRNSGGYILAGPEFLTVFNGETGAAMATVDYVPSRYPVNGWGSNEGYGNRVDRFLAGVGYFDGERPSILMTRGYYGRSVLAAWDWRNGQLTQRWVFDTNTSGNGSYAGQGNHNLSIGDVDGDGKDEVIFGAMAIDDNGTRLHTTGFGHGDAMHLSDLDPTRPGMEVFTIHEPTNTPGASMRDARTGQILWNTGNADVGRGIAVDVDPRYPGAEVWGFGGMRSVKGEVISSSAPYANFAVWWDGDLLRELLNGDIMDKWNHSTGSLNRVYTLYQTGASKINGSKANPNLSADLFGDWREELIFRHYNEQELLIFTTTIPTEHKIFTLMHDPQYRVSVAWQNVSYNQPPHTSFFLGHDMATPPTPNIRLVGAHVTGLGRAKEPGATQAIFVYPNPSAGAFNIITQGGFSYSIYDQLGRTLATADAVNETVAGEQLRPGIYFIRIETKQGSRVERVLKQ